ncbi:MAG: RecQ family ATP-dependent DNA helicase, partial [Candidatus Spyradosoma sp.]
MPDDTPQEILKKHFGFERFREPQGSIVETIVGGRDALVIMPTGGGKSLCYQLPALMLPHLTLVVSPLIALMKDQVDALRARGIEAACLNSAQTLEEQNEIFAKIRAGTLKLVYVAPERFRAARFVETIARTDVSLFAVDEAHCLSQWGHDFRPDYLRLDAALAKFRKRPVVAAFTATATPDVREDIAKHLKLREPAEFVAGFARDNLAFNIRHIEPGTSSRRGEGRTTLHLAKISELKKLADAHRTGIVYCATRKSVERVSDDLGALGVNLVMYHGGMSDVERSAAQDRFMSREADVAVATNAFGMGIDRADIRFVAHYEMPGSVEAYYQEAGRAGRDGAPAVCEMLFNYADKRVQEFFIEGANPGRRVIRAVYDTLRALADEGNELRISVDDLAERTEAFCGEKLNPMAVSTSIGLLARFGAVERFDVPGTRVRGTRLLFPDLKSAQLEIPWDGLDEKKARDEKKLEDLIRIAYSPTCRQEAILRYFGDVAGARPCGRCDVCVALKNTVRRVPDVDELTVVKKILSGVARMSRKGSDGGWTPRFGRQRIVDCLVGSRNAGTLQAGCDRLSTYGILRREGREYVSALMDEMIKEG